jgi:predicted DNA-binding transcriptional regulator AlpA
MLDQLLSDRDVEKITGRARSTLQKDRVSGSGIPFIRLGRLVRYRQSDVTAFLDALPRCHSTSEATPNGEGGACEMVIADNGAGSPSPIDGGRS